jgi:hypothetical protein
VEQAAAGNDTAPFGESRKVLEASSEYLAEWLLPLGVARSLEPEGASAVAAAAAAATAEEEEPRGRRLRSSTREKPAGQSSAAASGKRAPGQRWEGEELQAFNKAVEELGGLDKAIVSRPSRVFFQLSVGWEACGRDGGSAAWRPGLMLDAKWNSVGGLPIFVRVGTCT